MKKIKSLFLLIFSVLFPAISFAQNSDVEMADLLRQDGKIYVVIGVICIILIGLLLFLLIIDRKVRNLEQNQNR